MSEDAQVNGFTDAENQFFESGGEIAPEATDDTAGQETQQEAGQQEAEIKQAAEQEKAQGQSEQEQSQDGKMVPLAALHESRGKIRELKDQMGAMESRFQQVLSKMEQKDQPPVPDFDNEPLEAIKHQQDQLSKMVEQQNMTLAQQQQATREQQYREQLVSTYQQDAARFSQQQPDFMAAYSYMYNSRQAELSAIGYTQNEIAQILQNEEFALVNQAIQSEMSPSEVLYQVAKARGYTHNPQAQAQNKTQGKTEEERKLEMAAAGVEASQSLSSNAGKSEKELSLEALADMDDDEFEKNWDKLIGG